MERGSVGRARFGVLGPLQVLDRGGQPVPLGGPKARELLAALLLHPRQILTTQRLVDWLWGVAAGEGASTTLRTHIANVRQILQRAEVSGALVNRPGSYALMVDPTEIDWFAFERGLERGQEALALGAPGDARVRLAEALGLWRGNVLSDVAHDGFAGGAVARMEELRIAAEEATADAELALGRHQEIVGRLLALVEAQPYRERFTAQLMVALYRCGRQAEALDVYGSTRRRLSDELGIDPGPELRELETAMLRQDATLFGDTGAPRSASSAPVTVAAPPDAVFAALRRTAMVGRTDELASLEQLWRNTLAGGHAVVFVSGPGGVGKSRLAAEVAHLAADDGAVVVVGRCADASVPFAPLSSGLRGSPAIEAALDAAPAHTRARLDLLVPTTEPAASDIAGYADGGDALLKAVQWLIRVVAAGHGLLLVVEDADRIDSATALLLRDLAAGLPPGVMLMVCLRDPPGSRYPALLQLMGDAAVRQVAHAVVVPPLSAMDLTAMITGITGRPATEEFARRLAQHTGGNPFFAGELVRDLGSAPTDRAALSTVPVSVRDVLRQRLSKLPRDTRDALAAAAVLGLEVELLTLTAVLAMSEDRAVADLDAAVESGFLVESGQSWAGAYAFPHELMRDAVYGEIAPYRRRRLHLSASVALLSATVVADVDVLAAAAHLQKAGPEANPSTLVELSQRASAVARRGFAWAEAVHHAEAALTVLSRTAPPEQRAGAQVEVAVLRLRAGIGHQRIIELLEAALGEYLILGDLAAAGMVHSRLGGALCVHHSVMDIPRALEHFDAAERLMPRSAEVFHLHRGRAQAAMYGLRTTELAAASERVGELAAQLGRNDLMVFACWGQAWNAIDRGDLAVAFAKMDEAWAMARDLGDGYLVWGPVDAVALFATELLLDPASGRAWCRRGLRQPRFDSYAHPHASVLDQLCLAMIEMGEIDDARGVVDALPTDALSRRLLRFCDGDWEQALADWTAALRRDEEAGDLQDAVLNARWCGEALTTLRRDTEAVQVLTRALEISVSGPQVPCELWIRSRLTQLVVSTDPAAAAVHLARCTAIMASGQDWRGLRGEMELAGGVLSAAAGDWPRAEESFEEAAAVFLTYQLPWRRAAVFKAWAWALSDAGLTVQADDRRQDAMAVYRNLGAVDRWLRSVDAAPPEPSGSTLPQRELNAHRPKLVP